jgi:hypothetical protein
MKYLIVTMALLVMGLSFLTPPRVSLFPERPYHGAYSSGEANLPSK